MTCAFDGDTFDLVAFDVCVPVPSGGAPQVYYFPPPLREKKDDDEDVLAVWFYLEKMQ